MTGPTVRRAAALAVVALLALSGCSDDSGNSIEIDEDTPQQDGPTIAR